MGNGTRTLNLFIVSVLPLLAAVLAAPAPQADAQQGLRARVLMTQARVPRRLDDKALWKFARENHGARLLETREATIGDRAWPVNIVTRFNRKPDGHEVQLLFYDIHGTRRFVVAKSMFVGMRNERTFSKKIKLERPMFHPNRRHEVVVTVSRREVGKLRFALVGDTPKRNNVFDFTAE